MDKHGFRLTVAFMHHSLDSDQVAVHQRSQLSSNVARHMTDLQPMGESRRRAQCCLRVPARPRYSSLE